MKKFIVCPYCESVNDNSEISQEERVFLFCHNCDEEIGEVIPKLDYFYEFCHFAFNFLLYVCLIALSAEFFENYPEWKITSGFIFTFTIMIFSIALHEFFHAFFAFVFGDYSVFSKGYLRLNIFKYIDGLNSIFFPSLIFLFSGVFFPGGAVFIREENIRFRIFNFIVNIAGIFSQVIFIWIILILINSETYTFSNDFKSLLHVSAFLQILILISNLLPIPGLDGWNAIFSLMGKSIRNIGNIFSNLLFFPIALGFIICVYSFRMFDEELSFVFGYIFVLTSQLNLDKQLISEGFSFIQPINLHTLELFRDRFMSFANSIIETIHSNMLDTPKN